MNRLYVLTGVLALAVVLTGVKAEDEKEFKIKDVMKQHGKGGLRLKVTEAVKDKEWDTAAKASKEWVKLAEKLGTATPPMGAKASWKKLTSNYEKQVKAVAAAAESKDDAKAEKALKAISGMCGTCHKAHKGK